VVGGSTPGAVTVTVIDTGGPVGTVDAPPTEAGASVVKPACVEITPSRESVVGAMRVRRALPRIGRRTVGAWCFADHMGPELVTETRGLDIGPHPHTGLQTVTWLVAGEVLHRDSLGSEQVIRAGQVNLMTGTSWLGDLHSTVDPGSRRTEVFSVREVSRQEVQDLMKQGVQLVDVLPTEEFQDDHLPGAINLPLRKIETEARRALDPSRPVVVYCWDSA
jgi:hypothetical protein